MCVCVCVIEWHVLHCVCLPNLMPTPILAAVSENDTRQQPRSMYVRGVCTHTHSHIGSISSIPRVLLSGHVSTKATAAVGAKDACAPRLTQKFIQRAFNFVLVVTDLDGFQGKQSHRSFARLTVFSLALPHSLHGCSTVTQQTHAQARKSSSASQ